ncbi:MAG: hypothetical protein V1874_07255 [Spirochaetota bacterium]
MKSITIHNMDDSIESLIHEKAKSQKISLNKTIQILLKQALGLNLKKGSDHREEFLDLFAVWSKNDENEFNSKIKDLNKINKEDWE